MSRTLCHSCGHVALWIALVLALIGCKKSEPIVEYTIPTTVPDELKEGNRRMLAAMVPRGEDVWIYKVAGPEEAVAEIASTYRKFVQKVPYNQEGPTLDSLPPGWRMGATRPMRFATIDVNTDVKQLDISISSIPNNPDWDSYVLENVNRWRGQLGLDPSKEGWGGGTPIDVPASDGSPVWVDLVGEGDDQASMMPPFASGMPGGGLPPGHPPTETNSSNTPPPEDSSIKFDRPEGWRDGRRSEMRKAAFEIGPEDRQAELTVIRAGGDLRQNVSLWMGQVGMKDVTSERVDQELIEADTIEVDAIESKRFLFVGSSQPSEDDREETPVEAIDITVVPLGAGESFYVKMKGPKQTVIDHADEVSAFLSSLKLNP